MVLPPEAGSRKFAGNYWCATCGTYTLVMHKWDSWVDHVTNGASARAIAAAIGGSNTTVARWSREENVPAEGAVAVARAYGADPIEALCAAGYLTDDDLVGAEVVGGLRGATTLQLVEELLRRTLIGELAPDPGYKDTPQQ